MRELQNRINLAIARAHSMENTRPGTEVSDAGLASLTCAAVISL